MFITALFVIIPNRKQPNYSSTGDWINKLWYAYSARKRTYCHHRTWMNLTVSKQMKPDTKNTVIPFT